MSREQELALREQVRAALTVAIPAEHVDQVLDLALFAAQSAFQSADRVLASAGDDRHFIAALAPAVGVIAGRCQHIEAGLTAYATAQGMATSQARVAFGEQG